MANAAVEAMLGSTRSFAVAAAGCGKTELLGQIVADQRSGRQLVLTHTHAGVAAIKKRLAGMYVPQEKFHLDTIAGWCLRYGAAYPAISGYQPGAEANPDWNATYPGAEKVCRTALGKKIISESYSGLLVDEYQDCTISQHSLMLAIAAQIPCRGVGDPLQSIFGFADPVVEWGTIKADFQVMNDALTEPWRWRREGKSAVLGDWLAEARKQLEQTGRLVIAADAPVTWVQHDNSIQQPDAWASVCRTLDCPLNETTVAILKWPSQCINLAQRMGGRWPIVERFDDPDLLRLGSKLVDADGPEVVEALVGFLSERMTMVGTAMRTAVEAIKSGRGVSRIKKHRDHADRLDALATNPSPAIALEWLAGALAHRDNWWLYRRECVYQLREALRHCSGSTFAELPNMIAEARTRARHRGRLTHRRTIGTPLLVKGLEFDHGILLWEPSHLSVKGLYVAITRASKSLTIVSNSRTLVPEGT
ncbi:MAG: ATP-dependent helicase [Verrucomicrobia bacterium]|nr:MAG: ATP-dependent helicase [Verrucomicrobiota bacterium]